MFDFSFKKCFEQISLGTSTHPDHHYIHEHLHFQGFKTGTGGLKRISFLTRAGGFQE